MTTLLVDNFDSFTHNLDQAIRSLGIATSVVRVDSPSLKGIVERRTFSTLVISPGPKHPQDAAVSVELIRRFFGLVPILGVCLGQQCLAFAFGGRVDRLPRPIHGRATLASHHGTGLFRGLKDPMLVARYHSLYTPRTHLPTRFRVDAVTEDDIPMAISNEEHAAYGVQFHPESFLTPLGLALLANFFEIASKWHPRTTSPTVS